MLLAILLFAFALRAAGLGAQELRGDEAFGYFFSLRPVADQMAATIALREPHPIASYIVERQWIAWAGASEYALRFVSLWFGMLAVALLGRLAHRLGLQPAVTLLGIALMAISPYAIWHSQDARMYSMSLALTLASTWLAVEWLSRRRWPWGLAYVAVSWLGLHTHYFGGFVLLAQSLFVATRALGLPRLWNTLSAWVSLQLLLALLYLPWLTQATAILTGYGGNGDSPGLAEMAQRALSVFAVGESAPTGQRTGWAWAAAALLLVGLVRLVRDGPGGRRAAWLLLLYLITPLLATWYSAQSRPIFNERYLIAAAPPFYLLLAAAVAMPMSAHWRLRVVPLVSNVLLVILLLGVVSSLHRHYTDPTFSKTRGWRALAATLARHSASLPAAQMRIAQNFPDPTLWYYYTGPVAHLVLPPGPHDPAGTAREVQELADEGVARVLLPVQPAANWDDAAIASAGLAEHFRLAATTSIGVWPVEIYVAPPTAMQPLGATFANGLRLDGYAVQPALPVAGDYLVLFLTWHRMGATLTGTEVVFAQLLNTAGQLAAQADRPLADSVGAEAGLYAILLPESLPSGAYRLIAGVYDPAQTGAPRIALTTGEDHMVLTELEIGPAHFTHPHQR